MEKIGLVLEGGGVRGAFTAGALTWLHDNNITFDYSAGVSSGAVYLACFLSDNMEAAKLLATKFACSPEVVGARAFLKEGHYVAYKYLVENCMKDQAGLSLEHIREEKPEVEIGVYDLGLGRTVWYGADDLDDDLTMLRASCALPIASAVVDYKGKRFLDGGITKMVPIERALEQGCTKCLVITTKPKDYVRKPAAPIVENLMKVVYHDCPQIAEDYHVRHLNYNTQMDLVRELEKENKAILIYPSKTIDVSRWKGDEAKCKELFQLGYDDMEARRDEIMAFMKKDDDSKKEDE